MLISIYHTCVLQTWMSTVPEVTASSSSTSSRKTPRRNRNLLANSTLLIWPAVKRYLPPFQTQRPATKRSRMRQRTGKAQRTETLPSWHFICCGPESITTIGITDILLCVWFYRWVKLEQRAQCWTKPRWSTSPCLHWETSSLLWQRVRWGS